MRLSEGGCLARQLTLEEVMTAIAGEFHRARNLTVTFVGMEEVSQLDIGWSAGALFGIHLALTYPKLAARLNKALFSHENEFGVHIGADIVAEAISKQFFPIAMPNDEDLMEKWMRIKPDAH